MVATVEVVGIGRKAEYPGRILARRPMRTAGSAATLRFAAMPAPSIVIGERSRHRVPPLIAVTTSEIRPGDQGAPTPEGEPPQQEMVLGIKYLKAVEAAGGIPVVIPPLADGAIDPLLDRVSGLCLSGGPDLHPAAYRHPEHPALGPTWPELDSFELALVRAADRRELPILAVCRGLQVLNIARGGTLHQHLPDVVGTDITHRQQAPGEHPTHSVQLRQSTRLSRILHCARAQVNSFHHQAVDVLGSGLIATSHAPDGTVESVEALDRNFAVGVQWHVECLIGRPRQMALFGCFVEAAREFTESSHLKQAA
jgi:putative glutamine amidotransferase